MKSKITEVQNEYTRSIPAIRHNCLLGEAFAEDSAEDRPPYRMTKQLRKKEKQPLDLQDNAHHLPGSLSRFRRRMRERSSARTLFHEWSTISIEPMRNASMALRCGARCCQAEFELFCDCDSLRLRRVRMRHRSRQQSSVMPRCSLAYPTKLWPL